MMQSWQSGDATVLEISTPDGIMGVLSARPDGDGPFPVVVLFHDGPGIREATLLTLRRIADAGYYVVAPDRYHRHGRFVHVRPEDLMAAGRDSALMKSFFGMVMATTDEHVRADLDALLLHSSTDPAARRGPMGCIGYCNGVRSLLRAMSEHADVFAAGAGFHPSFCVSDDIDSPHTRVGLIRGELYLALGQDDHVASVEHNGPLLDEVRKLGARGTVDVLAGADHGFAVPGPNYHEAASARAYERTLTSFARRLRAP